MGGVGWQVVSGQLPLRHCGFSVHAVRSLRCAAHVMAASSQNDPSWHSSACPMQAAPFALRVAQVPVFASQKSATTQSLESSHAAPSAVSATQAPLVPSHRRPSSA
jgi:hypothetical protein